ncbi:hypothetical protein FS842_002387 [Serendipita sp. 407]|nr:hypothetical protein FS842_002387 [Serendipita sp. 407]
MAAAGPSLADQLRLLEETLLALQASRYTSAAAATIFVYDILLTFDDEVQFFWRKFRFTFPNILYIINRYVGLGFFLSAIYDYAGFHGDLSDAHCSRFSGLIGFALAHLAWTGIMTIRVSALWQSHPRLIRLTWCLWVCTMAMIVGLSTVTYFKLIEHMTYNPIVRICASMASPKILMATPIPPTVYELFLTVLTLIKAYGILSKIPGRESPSLLRVLARDGVAYFVIGSIISLGNLIAWHFLPTSLMALLLYLYWALLSSCVARLVLNLRQTYYTTYTETHPEVVSANVTFTNKEDLQTTQPNTKAKTKRRGKFTIGYGLGVRTRSFFMGDGELGVDASGTSTLAGTVSGQGILAERETENDDRDRDRIDHDDVERGRQRSITDDAMPLQTLTRESKQRSSKELIAPGGPNVYRTSLGSLEAMDDIK